MNAVDQDAGETAMRVNAVASIESDHRASILSKSSSLCIVECGGFGLR